jgi:DNA-binding NarL/FixJ family response regulator
MSLTRRQWEVLRLRALGYSYDEIATRLGLRPTTIRNVVQGIYERLDVNTLVDALSHPDIGWLVVPGEEKP